MRTFRILATLLLLAIPLPASAQGVPDIAEPFKVGTFEIDGTPTVSLVLRDQLIVEVDAANTALQRDPYYARVQAPGDMLELIERYEYGLQRRLYEVVNHLVENDMLGAGRPSYVHDLEDVRTLPPILYPGKILNAAVNFYSHVNETGTDEERAEARRQRRENRGVPYLFLKPSKGAVIGDGGEVVLPYGRDRIDWEVELGAVIGRSAKYVSANDAETYVFGYLVSLDISDRGGRPPGGNPMTSDWFVGRATTPSRPRDPGSCRRNSTGIRWRSCARRSTSATSACRRPPPAT